MAKNFNSWFINHWPNLKLVGEMHDYVSRVNNKMRELDSQVGTYYRLQLDCLVAYPKDVPQGTEFDRRRMAIKDGLEYLEMLHSHQAVVMAWDDERDGKCEYSTQAPPYLSVTLDPCPGPFELEFLHQLHYLSKWGVGGRVDKTDLYLYPDICDRERQLSMTFNIDGYTYHEEKPIGERWERKSILHGGLIYSGPTTPPELERHIHKWPKVWSVHT